MTTHSFQFTALFFIIISNYKNDPNKI
uniref:Uncharacterized protein n=1 Tax=Rhizophora mucronata TaxID=61149 RepID=A0A2P2NDZ1_RHIMU